MNFQASRQFTLIDAMILIATVAVGFAGVRAELTRHLHPCINYIEKPFDPTDLTTFTTGSATVTISTYSVARSVFALGGRSPWFSKAWEWAESARLAAPCLAALSLSMLLIRLRRPRPPWPRLIRQAGMVASLGATVALDVRLSHALLKLLLEYFNPTMSIPSTPPGPSRLSWIACQTTQPHLIGVVVLASWLVLAMGGCRRDRGWINLCGIAVGWGWIGLLLVDLFRNEPP